VNIDRKLEQATIDMIKEKEREALFIPTDITDSPQVKSIVAKVIEKYGKMNILVNSADLWCLGNILDTDERLWDKIMDMNLRVAFLCCKYCISLMIKSGVRW